MEVGIGIIVTIILIALILFALFDVFSSVDSNNKTDKIKSREEHRQKVKAEQEYKYSQITNSYKSKFGEPTKIISFKSLNDYASFDKEIWIYEKEEIIIIKNTEYPFKSIIGYNITDNQNTVSTTFSEGGTTSSGSMLKRGLVGGLAFGGIGALAGAVTAKKGEVFSESTTTTTHNYIVSIHLDSLANPIIELKVKEMTSKVQELAACLSIIIRKNETASKTD